MKEGFSFFEYHRRALSTVFLVAGLFLVLVTQHTWVEGGTVDTVFDWAGVILVAKGVLGRVWATMYIGGKKNSTLVTTGPYSMCRNPLYLFSFIAGLGVTVAFENLLLIGLYVLAFSLYYPNVIRSEEKRLESIFGAEFVAYKGASPAFFPKLTGLNLGKLSDYSARLMFKNFMDGSVFILMLPVAYIVERLHESGVLPVLLRIP